MDIKASSLDNTDGLFEPGSLLGVVYAALKRMPVGSTVRIDSLTDKDGNTKCLQTLRNNVVMISSRAGMEFRTRTERDGDNKYLLVTLKSRRDMSLKIDDSEKSKVETEEFINLGNFHVDAGESWGKNVIVEHTKLDGKKSVANFKSSSASYAALRLILKVREISNGVGVVVDRVFNAQGHEITMRQIRNGITQVVSTIGPIDIKTKTMRLGESKDKKLVIWVDPKLKMHEPIDNTYRDWETDRKSVV